MKQRLYILILMMIFAIPLQAQNTGMYAEVIINNITRISQDTIQFEVVLKRLSDEWRYFANSTFHLTFDTTLFPFDASNLRIRRDSSGLTEGVLIGNNNPLGGYTFSEQIKTNKIILGILCPETIEESQLFVMNNDFVIGKYTVYTTDKRWMPVDVKWIMPTNYYQKAAYKLEKDSINGLITLFHKNDNLDLINRKRVKLGFRESYRPFGDTIVLVNFDVDYAGQKKMDISWITLEELNVVGYTIKRAFRQSSLDDPALLNYQVIYTWRKDSTNKFHPEMLSKGDTKTGFLYGILKDTVEIRGGEYCYQLYCSFFDSLKVPIDKDIFLAQTCEPVPNSLIISAQIISENPYNDEITIEFQLADDCLLTIGSYDLVGKLIEKLKDNESGEKYDSKKMELGTYRVTFDPMPEVSSASYYIYLIAYPLNDNTMETSQVAIKIMNIK